MNVLVPAWLIAASFFGLALLETPKINAEDLHRLTGAPWTGTLTYVDYRTNKKVSLPSNLTVTPSAADKLSWVFEYQYPDEPKANNKETVTISPDGRIIDGEAVIEKTNLAGNTLKIVTEKSGADNDRKALFRFTYLLNASSFSITKEVRYEGATEFFERNQYRWTR
ncbi:MAG: hypothetical protein ACRD9R_00460 [Pyrinomonadaceae bacterium]